MIASRSSGFACRAAVSNSANACINGCCGGSLSDGVPGSPIALRRCIIMGSIPQKICKDHCVRPPLFAILKTSFINGGL